MAPTISYYNGFRRLLLCSVMNILNLTKLCFQNLIIEYNFSLTQHKALLWIVICQWKRYECMISLSKSHFSTHIFSGKLNSNSFNVLCWKLKKISLVFNMNLSIYTLNNLWDQHSFFPIFSLSHWKHYHHYHMASKSIALVLLFIFGFWAFEATAHILQEAFMQESHEQWMAEHGKAYKDPNEKMRYNIFKENMERIEAF